MSMREVRCTYSEPAGERCQRRAPATRRLCSNHDPVPSSNADNRWRQRNLALDLLALDSPLEDRESILRVLDAVTRLHAAHAIDRQRARAILRGCESAIRELCPEAYEALAVR